jgi:hypothetical protein
MEFFVVVVLVIIFVLIPILKGIASDSKTYHPSTSKAKLAENKVGEALRTLDPKSYVIFENVILPSNGNTAHTEIDHIVVSPFGIFCIETKSHSGAIYAYKKNKAWTQYLAGQKFTFHSPHHQNYKHVKAIEALFKNKLNAPIHSYAVFPNADKIVTDTTFVYEDPYELVQRIEKHTRSVYNIAECTHILKTLAYATSLRDTLATLHTEEVQAFLATKVRS